MSKPTAKVLRSEFQSALFNCEELQELPTHPYITEAIMKTIANEEFDARMRNLTKHLQEVGYSQLEMDEMLFEVDDSPETDAYAMLLPRDAAIGGQFDDYVFYTLGLPNKLAAALTHMTSDAEDSEPNKRTPRYIFLAFFEMLRAKFPKNILIWETGRKGWMTEMRITDDKKRIRGELVDGISELIYDKETHKKTQAHRDMETKDFAAMGFVEGDSDSDNSSDSDSDSD